ncbi:hypothetical protein ECG_05148 [Echinococcus granulosus]|nr:hypothetical protein ECG_05148 [Echinococcus granulosus]
MCASFTPHSCTSGPVPSPATPSTHSLLHFLKLCTSYPRATQGSHLDLFAPTCHLNYMPDGDAEFYSPHIICGPQCLRAMRTVHWDIFPLHSGHLLITRVHRPPDTLEKQRPPNGHDVCGTAHYMKLTAVTGFEKTTKRDERRLAF